jgi:hypothetical protein
MTLLGPAESRGREMGEPTGSVQAREWPLVSALAVQRVGAGPCREPSWENSRVILDSGLGLGVKEREHWRGALFRFPLKLRVGGGKLLSEVQALCCRRRTPSPVWREVSAGKGPYFQILSDVPWKAPSLRGRRVTDLHDSSKAFCD